MVASARRGAAFSGCLLVLLLWAACGRESGAPSFEGVPIGTPIVLISVDTLRSDRLPAYGYEAVATPGIDRLAADSILFERAYSHVPLTLPSHISALTGKLPPQHGVRDNVGYRLAEDPDYLPARLRQLGYATGGAVSAYVLRGATGMEIGFDWYEDSIDLARGTQLGGLQRPGGETLRLTKEWLDSVDSGPFFLFFHIYEPHTPYEPREPWASRYADPYDGEVADADEIVGALLADLRDRGRYDASLVILMSDHGESLGEHGYDEHQMFVYREDLQVPLLLKLPGNRLAGTRIATPVQLADVYATILDALGQPLPAGIAGMSLLEIGDETPPRPIYSESYYGELHFGWSGLRSLVKDRFQLIWGPDPELFDLEADPESLRNVLDQNRPVATELRRDLEALSGDGLNRPGAVDVETRSRLEALGYLGTSARKQSTPVDPKSRLDVITDLGKAFSLSSQKKHAEAEAVLRRILAREPDLVDGWEYLGRALAAQGRPEEALEAYERALEITEGAPQVALDMAAQLMELGRLEEAREYAEIASAGAELAYDVLAQIALKQNDLDAAERYLRDALRTRGLRVGPRITQAELLLRRERHQETLDLTREIEAEFGANPDRELLTGLYLIRGNAQIQLGDAEGAERSYLAEIEIAPHSLQAYSRLAFLYAVLDRGPEAGRTLQRMVQANDTPRAYAEAVRTLRAMQDPASADQVLRVARSRWPQAPELAAL